MSALPPPTKFVPFPIVKRDQRAVLGVAVAFAILPVIAVALRLLARRISKRSLDASDYCIVAACIFAVALESISISAVVNCGIGYGHVSDIVVEFGMEPITTLFKLLIPLQFLWALSLCFSKISILLLYSNVFPVPFVTWTARGAIGFIAAWSIATILTGCFICRPFAMNWDPTIPGGKCGNQVLSFTVTGVLNLITDVMVLVLPLPYLARLQMELYKKLVLIGVFSVGLLTCIVSAVRIHSLSSMDFTDITFSIPPANIFSGLEPSVAVVLACIPLLRPLLGRSRYSPNGTARRYGGSSSRSAPSAKAALERDGAAAGGRSGGGGGGIGGGIGPFEPLTDDSSQYRLRPVGPKHHAEVRSSSSGGGGAPKSASDSRSSSDLDGEGPEGIVVRSQWRVEPGRSST